MKHNPALGYISVRSSALELNVMLLFATGPYSATWHQLVGGALITGTS